jgi:ferredoxin
VILTRDPSPEVLIRVVVDPNKCQGTGYCELVNSQIFAVDEQTQVVRVINTLLATPTEDVFRDVKEAVDLCPLSALSVKGGLVND